MEKEKIIYIVVENYHLDSGEKEIYTSAFSTIEKAEKYFEKLKERYAESFDTKNRNATIYENNGEIEVSFYEDSDNTTDYYSIIIDEKIIDSEVE